MQGSDQTKGFETGDAPCVTRAPMCPKEPSDNIPNTTLNQVGEKILEANQQAYRDGKMIFVGNSPGSGKSYSDVQMSKQVDVHVIAVPDHANSREVLADHHADGVPIAATPQLRLRNANSDCVICRGGGCPECGHTGEVVLPTNCWNPEAEAVLQAGLNVTEVLCKDCPYKDKCRRQGYKAEKIAAAKSKAKAKVTTHHMVGLLGASGVFRGASRISLQENARNIIKPMRHMTEEQALNALALSTVAASTGRENVGCIRILNWIAQTFCHGVVDALKNELPSTSRKMAAIDISHLLNPELGVSKVPAAVLTAFYDAFTNVRNNPGQESIQLLIDAAMGRLESLWIEISVIEGSNGKPASWRKRLCGIYPNQIPDGIPVTYSSATEDPKILAMLDDRFVDATVPEAEAEHLHCAEQIPIDITKGSSPSKAVMHLLAALDARPRLKKVAVVCLKKHRLAIEKLAEQDRRIHKVVHFGSGEDRGINSLPVGRDAVIVLGTYRHNQLDTLSELLRAGQFEVANEDPDWGTVEWEGTTVSGKKAMVKHSAFRHPVWARFHNQIVRGNIIQAGWRSRFTRDEGCRLVVISTQECGLPLSDTPHVTLTPTQRKVLDAIKYAIKNSSKDKVTRSDVVAFTGMKERAVKRILAILTPNYLIRHGKTGCGVTYSLSA